MCVPHCLIVISCDLRLLSTLRVLCQPDFSSYLISLWGAVQCNSSLAAECETVHFRSSESPAGNMRNLAFSRKSMNSSASRSTHVSFILSTNSLISSFFSFPHTFRLRQTPLDCPHREPHLNSLQLRCC